MLSKRNILSICFLLTFAACGSTTPFITADQWEKVSSNVQEVEYKFPIDQESQGKMYLYKLNGNNLEYRFVHSDVPKWIFQWYRDLGEPILVINGVYFHEDLSPSGFFVSDGQQTGTLEFDQDKTALINLDEGFEIINTRADEVDLEVYKNAAQSYPLLVVDGVAAVKEDSGLLARRSFVGSDINGVVYFGVVPKHKISLFKLSQVLIRTGISWESVINLDGGPSTGIAINKNGEMNYHNNFTPVPNVLVVED